MLLKQAHDKHKDVGSLKIKSETDALHKNNHYGLTASPQNSFIEGQPLMGQYLNTELLGGS